MFCRWKEWLSGCFTLFLHFHLNQIYWEQRVSVQVVSVNFMSFKRKQNDGWDRKHRYGASCCHAYTWFHLRTKFLGAIWGLVQGTVTGTHSLFKLLSNLLVHMVRSMVSSIKMQQWIKMSVCICVCITLKQVNTWHEHWTHHSSITRSEMLASCIIRAKDVQYPKGWIRVSIFYLLWSMD